MTSFLYLLNDKEPGYLIGITNRIQIRQSRNWGLTTGRGRLPSPQCPVWLWHPPSPWILEGLFPGIKVAGAHLHLVPRLRMCGTIPPVLYTSSSHGAYLSTVSPSTLFFTFTGRRNAISRQMICVTYLKILGNDMLNSQDFTISWHVISYQIRAH